VSGDRPPWSPVRGCRRPGRSLRLLPGGCAGAVLAAGLRGARRRGWHASGIAGCLALAASAHVSLPPAHRPFSQATGPTVATSSAPLRFTLAPRTSPAVTRESGRSGRRSSLMPRVNPNRHIDVALACLDVFVARLAAAMPHGRFARCGRPRSPAHRKQHVAARSTMRDCRGSAHCSCFTAGIGSGSTMPKAGGVNNLRHSLYACPRRESNPLRAALEAAALPSGPWGAGERRRLPLTS
jgi:hypothetical protein